MSLTLFATSAPGLEALTRQELTALGGGIHVSRGGAEGGYAGGVTFHSGLSGIYRANLHLRTAGRILLRLGGFMAIGFTELREQAAALAWEDYLLPGQAVIVRATSHKSRLYHSDAVAERVLQAIGDRLGQEVPTGPDADEDEQLPAAQIVFVRIVHDRVTLSLDTSGEPLHRRGYRLATAKAPMRETLAAGLLLASGWDGGAPLLDPFCGSGTIAIEAALLARKIAPGKARRFAFMNWPNFNPGVWKGLLAEAESQELAEVGAAIQASDRDDGAIQNARENAGRAEVNADIQFERQAFSGIRPVEGPGWVISNPPYGLRTAASTDLRNLYSRLGNVLRARCPGWQVGLLTTGEYLAGHTGLTLEPKLGLVNGGVAVKFFCGTV